MFSLGHFIWLGAIGITIALAVWWDFSRENCGSSSLSQTIKRENADAFSLFMAGIAGLEPAMQESKSCALTDLAISHRYGLLYHIRRRCVKMTWVSCFLFWEVFVGCGELFRESSP